jgi:arsenate reductase (glutaredoxin)
MLTLYTYAKCGTCRKAIAHLAKRGIPFVEKPIRDQPPSLAELKAMHASIGDLRRLFNTSGQDYRALGIKDVLPGMTDAQALRLLAGNGNLIKRPFVPLPDGGLVGFDAAEWQRRIR